MTKVYAIANQKGGVAKTTTATALAGGLQLRGYRVLLIDTDPQCNASDTYQAQIEGVTTLYDMLCNNEPASEAIQNTKVGNIIASDPLLSQAENLLNRTGKEHLLRKSAVCIASNYDYIIIDTPPALGVLLVNALTFADAVIVPITADRYSMQGLSQLRDTIEAVKEYTNPNLKVAGLLLAKFNARTNLSREVCEAIPEIAHTLNTVVFETTIRESVSAKEAQALRRSLYDHAPNSTTAIDYLSFVNELIERGM